MGEEVERTVEIIDIPEDYFIERLSIREPADDEKAVVLSQIRRINDDVGSLLRIILREFELLLFHMQNSMLREGSIYVEGEHGPRCIESESRMLVINRSEPMRAEIFEMQNRRYLSVHAYLLFRALEDTK